VIEVQSAIGKDDPDVCMSIHLGMHKLDLRVCDLNVKHANDSQISIVRFLIEIIKKELDSR
jgi:hypothetical protein